MIETKQKILDTAERLFGEQGYGATSLRQIIVEAGVNLAAIHYHFGSKEELLDRVVERKAEPVNRERADALDRLETEAGGNPVEIERVIEAFVAPALSRVAANPSFSKLMGRLLGEGLLPELAMRHFRTVSERYFRALARSLPEISPPELIWRVHWIIGAMAHSLCAMPEGYAALQGAEGQKALRKFVAFASGGLRAPAAETSGTEVK